MSIHNLPRHAVLFAMASLIAMASPVWSQAKKPVQTNATFQSADGTVLKA